MGLIQKNIQSYNEGNRYTSNEGSTRSGKTFAVLSTLFLIATNNRVTISVVSETFPHLRKGAIRDFISILQSWDWWDAASWSKSESTYNFANGSIIEFFSVDSPGKVHGPARDILFINEAQNISYDIARHLFVRTTGAIFIDFNPTHEFWAHTELKADPSCRWLHSTYKDNKYLSRQQVTEIERNRHNKHWWTVYGEGKIGQLDGLVIPSFTTSDTITPDGAMCYGLDFGYSNDPTALVQVVKAGDDIHVRQLIYRTGLLNRDIIALMREAGIRPGYDEIFADCAEPKSIEEIRQAGFNVKPADKGKDSIMGGVQFLNAHRLHVTKDSTDLIKELRNYTYITDSEGKPTNKPVDAYNHAIDALRYAVYTKFRPQQKEISYLRTSNRINK